MNLQIVFTIVSSALATGTVQAGTEVNLIQIDRGLYAEDGFHPQAPVSYNVGNAPLVTPLEIRSFFAYDLSDVRGTIVSAELRIRFGELQSSDPFERFELHDITTDMASILDGSSEIAGFEDLADGALFGAHEYETGVILEYVSIMLTQEALDSLNQADGLWGMGGSVSTLDDDPSTKEVFLNLSSDNSTLASTQLIVMVIPAPGVLALLGAAGLSGRRRRRRS
jgi:hypothetical protein